MNSCRSVDQLIERQKSALTERIKEAKKSEIRRLNAFSQAKQPELRKKLEERHKIEREYDQQQISQLLADFEKVKVISESGSIDITERRNSRPVSTIKTMDLDRFKKAVVNLDVDHKKQVYKSFERRDLQANQLLQKNNRNNYESSEYKKLELLKQKKELLSKLSEVTRNELMSCNQNSSMSTYRNQQSQGGGYGSYDTRSICTSRTTSTRASWATFATNTARDPSPIVHHRRLAAQNLPPLSLHRLHQNG